MIRINLLPVKAAKKRERAERTLYYMAFVLTAELAVLFFVHQWQAGDVEVLAQENAVIGQQIEKLKQEVGDFDAVKSERERLIAQRDIIRRLEAGRTGPVAVLLELSRILSVGGQPTVDPKEYERIRAEEPNKVYDPTWDPRRVAISSFAAAADATTHIDAYAKDNSDVAEFVKRLDISQLFDDPVLQGSDTVGDSVAAKGIKHVHFNLDVKVKY
ncbi:MAG: PilN domain-containing protein [Myxococcota bacterium]